MSRFSLRYQAMDLTLGAGEFVAGRGSDCNLVLDDSLVSRRHAAFRALDGSVEVEDLGSRNGVLVNDVRIEGRTQLRHGDRVRIGSQDLVVRDAESARAQAGTSELARCSACGEIGPADGVRCAKCGKAQSQTLVDLAAAPATSTQPGVRRLGAFSVLAPLVDKSFGMGRFEEAERVLSGPLNMVLQGIQARAESGSAREPDRDMLGISATYALRLAETLQKPSWVDYTFELFAAAGSLMTAEIVDDLYRVATAIRYAHPRPIRNYMAKLKASVVRLGPSERFLLQRLEGLERRIVSG